MRKREDIRSEIAKARLELIHHETQYKELGKRIRLLNKQIGTLQVELIEAFTDEVKKS